MNDSMTTLKYQGSLPVEMFYNLKMNTFSINA